MSGIKENFVIQRGSTFKRVIRWETSPIVYKAITGVTKTAPVSISAPSHGIPDGWRVALSGIIGTKELNAAFTPPRLSDFHAATVVNADTITINDIDAQLYTAYISGGSIQYNTPHDLTSYTARLQIRSSITSSTVALELTDTQGIVIDEVNNMITINITDEQTAAFTISSGVYSLEMTSPTGETTQILYGSVTVEKEVTRD